MATLEHVAITSTEETFAKTQAFYEQVFGMKEIRRGKDLVFLSDGQGGRIELLQYGGPMLANPNHLAFVVGWDEFDSTVTMLRGTGISIDDPIVAASGDRLCYFSDPAGNRAQIVGRHNPLPK